MMRTFVACVISALLAGNAFGQAAPTNPGAGLADGAEFDDCNGEAWCPRMVVVPAGSFTMGSPRNERGRRGDEGPQHLVSIPRFAVGKFEITFGEWAACVSGGGCARSRAPDDAQVARRPALGVTWNDAQAYVSWLSSRTGQTYRLLTEAEWEYAARGGTTGRFSNNGDDAQLCQVANHGELSFLLGFNPIVAAEFARMANTTCSDGAFNAVEVGQFAANPFGLYDVHGNISEMVEDCYRSSYARAPTDGTAVVDGDCALRVNRGGNWKEPLIRHQRSAARDSTEPDRSTDHTGFRVARVLTAGVDEPR